MGDISLPGDKSISHRAALLASLASGPSCLRNFPGSLDCHSTLRVLRQLGISSEEPTPGTVIVHGGGGRLTTPTEPLDCGNSGTTARLLMGMLASQPFDSTIDGDRSLCSRPMERVAAPLRLMGADITTTGVAKTLPVHIHGRCLRGQEFAPSVASAQLKSALLLAGLSARGTTTVTERFPTRDHTERALHRAGVAVRVQGHTISMEGPQLPHSLDLTIPGDISSAAFWMALAAPDKSSRMILRNVCLDRRRLGFVDALLRMGASIHEEVFSCGEDEWHGHLDIRGGSLRPIHISAAEVPSLIDEMPVLAVVAARARGLSTIRGAGELRHKETDRITAIVTNLRRMNVNVEEFSDGLAIHGTGRLRGGELDSFGDHRVAMAFTIAGLLADEPTTIHDTACIAISYPHFQRDLFTILGSSAMAFPA